MPNIHIRETGLRKLNHISQRRQWHPTPVLLPGKSHGRRSLVGCSPWGRTESDTTEAMQQQQQQQPHFLTAAFLISKQKGLGLIFVVALLAAATAAKSLQSCPTLLSRFSRVRLCATP